jgi:hypothetical protein
MFKSIIKSNGKDGKSHQRTKWFEDRHKAKAYAGGAFTYGANVTFAKVIDAETGQIMLRLSKATDKVISTR